MNGPLDGATVGRSAGDWSRAAADWLGLRRAADERARDEGAAHLLSRLGDHLGEGGVGLLEVVDVGAGTGANGSYLRPRLPCAQRWVVVDQDPEHLRHPDHGDAERLRAGVHELPALLEQRPRLGDARLLTCAALLDVLDRRELGSLADAVELSAAAALLALSVDGRVRMSPEHEADADVAAAFDAHQRRGDRPGPDAARVLAGLLRERGLDVTAATTWWRLGPARRGLLERWLAERVEAVLDEDPGSVARVRDWHALRREQLASGGLRALIAHVDLLVLRR